MAPPGEHAGSIFSSDARVAAWGVVTAALTSAGIFFQKLNGVRSGNPLVSGWLALAVICFFPTFVIANKVFLMGGRMSLFVPATAANYVFSMMLSRFYFGEDVSSVRWCGCALVIAGVTAIARG
jgi:drug/metabolite transporter (DMT)-like permease